MEDNIGDMMVDIRDVVSNHFSDIKKNLQNTMNIIDMLPVVIDLRKQIRTLENENKQLKMLVDSIGEEKNIELEIIEFPDNNTSLEDDNDVAALALASNEAPDDDSAAESDDDSDAESDDQGGDVGEFDDDALRANFADENELGIVIENEDVDEDAEKQNVEDNDKSRDI